MDECDAQKRPSLSTLAALALALLVPVLVACGGGEEADGGGGGEEAAFLEDADATCVEASESFIELTREPITSPAQGEALDAEVLDLREQATTRLAELEPPPELESDYDAYLAAEDELTVANQELADAFAANDEAEIQTGLEQVDRLEEEVDAAAAEVGLMACAGELPEEDLAEIGSTAREYLTSTDPSICGELVTEKLIAEVYDGELENCERDVERSEPPSEVTTSGPSGAGPSATLDAQLPDGETLDIFMIREDDGWKVDVVNAGA